MQLIPIIVLVRSRKQVILHARHRELVYKSTRSFIFGILSYIIFFIPLIDVAYDGYKLVTQISVWEACIDHVIISLDSGYSHSPSFPFAGIKGFS
jgi:hypothetical protein